MYRPPQGRPAARAARSPVGSRAMSIRWVRQEDPQGCSIACLAMLTGRTYAEVKAQCPNWNPAYGLGEWARQEWLKAQGFRLLYTIGFHEFSPMPLQGLPGPALASV